MRQKDVIQPNAINAPVLFVGVGGIGSKIVKGVSNRCLHDDKRNIRFVIMDTNVNDLLKSNGAGIVAVQTSDTRTVEEYLEFDKDAANKWFPVNKMLDPKPVSEGAGQVRAISRLALNSTIKQGEIFKLYQAIDDLFLKDGGSYKQAIRVVVCSTAAGGTGSGIAMLVAMLIRQYVAKAYPGSAAMIRGFLVMPGVMDTVIDTQNERESLRCNGYATIKEINAFMMKGSGFFDAVPELARYKDLHISVPSSGGGVEKLSCLPFDFCFLMDRTDANVGNMVTLDDYIDFAAQSVYEQNIGPMSPSAASMEDNVLKQCISRESYGRCRFGGVGASALVYPYDDIRDYLALSWARSSIIGSSADRNMSEDERKELLRRSWLQYDMEFRQQIRDQEDNPSAEKPRIEKSYVDSIRRYKEESSGNLFTCRLWKENIQPKILELVKASGSDANENSERMVTTLDDIEVESNTQEVARAFISNMIDEVINHRLSTSFPSLVSDVSDAKKTCSSKHSHMARFNKIKGELEDYSKDPKITEISKNFASAVFGSKASIRNSALGDYMLEKYLCVNGKPMHPNAARFMLYELKAVIKLVKEAHKKGTNVAEYEKALNIIKEGKEGNGSKEKFQVNNIRAAGKEDSLEKMCAACDKAKLFSGTEHTECNNHLNGYFNAVWNYMVAAIGLAICEVAGPAVDHLIQAYEEFYKGFENKVPSIERKKNDIKKKLKRKNGASIRYVFENPDYLDGLVSMVQMPTDSSDNEKELYANIFEALRSNSYIIAHRSVDSFSYVPKEDIFDDVIIKYFKELVEDKCDEVNVSGVLQALKLEFDVSVATKVDLAPEENKKNVQEVEGSEQSLKDYISGAIEVCRNLASPGVKKRECGERREVDAIACSDTIADGNGITVDEYLPKREESNSVSRYELRFFRSVYNITPIQLAKFCAPSYSDDEDEFSVSNKDEYSRPGAGEYFNIYQKYMDSIGPDSRKTAVITPHIDMRWNAICAMPELDLEYQKRLMRKIHKAFIYGLVYDRIVMARISDDDERVYKYFDGEERKIDLKVSNGTRCDVFYEVLDALYFDRQAVATLRDYISEVRRKSEEEGYKSFEESEFYTSICDLRHKKIVNLGGNVVNAERMSMFEIPLLYCNSLPTQSKDTDEMLNMIEAVKEIICAEVKVCTNNADVLPSRIAKALIAQYNLLVVNYEANKKVLRSGIFSDEVVESTYGVVYKYLKNNDLLKFKSEMKKVDID